MTLRRGNLDDMSMSLHSLKQTDNIRSDPQLLIIYEVIVISFLHDFLHTKAYCSPTMAGRPPKF